jgi:hypothetical protein
MTSHLLTPLRSIARRAGRAMLFGPPKPRMTAKERQRATTAKLRAELAANKLSELEQHLIAYRAVEQAICGGKT